MKILLTLFISATLANPVFADHGTGGSSGKDDGPNLLSTNVPNWPPLVLDADGLISEETLADIQWRRVGSSRFGGVVMKRGLTKGLDTWRFEGTAGASAVSGYKFGKPMTAGWVCVIETAVCTCQSDQACLDLVLKTAETPEN